MEVGCFEWSPLVKSFITAFEMSSNIDFFYLNLIQIFIWSFFFLFLSGLPTDISFTNLFGLFFTLFGLLSAVL
jgi:hypothetical protein